MTKRSELNLERLGFGFSVHTAYEVGVSPSRLRATDLVSSDWGTRQVRETGLLERCTALARRLDGAAVFTHSTAARLLNIPLPHQLESDATIHVTVSPPLRAPRGRRVAGHQQHLGESDVRLVGGIRVSTGPRTWCDLASRMDLPHLVAAGDSLVFHDHPQCSIAELVEAHESAPNARGARSRRIALEMLSPLAESPRESVLRAMILLARFPPPEVNHVVFDRRHRFLARVDLAWPEKKVAVEYEGDHHRTDRQQWQRDLQRTEALQDAGWRVIRVSAVDLENPTALFARLRSLLGA
jgi:very-short-patch-repair endonuclease